MLKINLRCFVLFHYKISFFLNPLWFLMLEKLVATSSGSRLIVLNLQLLAILFITVLWHWDFSHGKFNLLSQGKARCDNHATQPVVHARCLSVFITHRTLTWTTGSLIMHTNVDACNSILGCTDTLRETTLKVDSES